MVDASTPATQATPATETDPNNPPIQKSRTTQQRDVPKHPRIQNVILVSGKKVG